MKTLSLVVVLISFSGVSIANEMYRSPSSGDKGSYYIINSEKVGPGIVNVLSSRIGKDDAYTDFTQLKVDCKARKFFELAGGNEDGARQKPTAALRDWSANSRWATLVTGSSKYDLVNFVCKKHKNRNKRGHKTAA